MVKSERDTQGVGGQDTSLGSASWELVRSLGRLGLSVAFAPGRLLPDETRQHLRAAGHEALQAGITLKRGLLETSEDGLTDAHARLDELEEKLKKVDQQAD